MLPFATKLHGDAKSCFNDQGVVVLSWSTDVHDLNQIESMGVLFQVKDETLVPLIQIT